ncbi:DUF192 domain-containing protein [Candidatus Woesearchaeota archaeon]|nr:DUF192 domain-containing protein [Candidatus Woesearchaeota archaeon]
MITNTTRRQQLASQHKSRQSVLGRALGLMFCRGPKAMLFSFPVPRKYRIHMMFVFFPIDLLFLNSRKQVVELKEHLRPWQMYLPKQAYSFLIELPAGMVAKTRTEKGDTLLWK